MFTGIITHQAEVCLLEKQHNADLLLALKLKHLSLKDRQLIIGCSIACNGICLTLVKKQQTAEDIILFFQASAETVAKTTINNWQLQQIINLEFSLKLGDELGGHLLLGHIDTTTKILFIEQKNESWEFVFGNPSLVSCLIAKKGSVAINGVSLTVNDIDNTSFAVNIIPHTFFHTNFQFLQITDEVNLEVDPFARYLANYLQHQNLSLYAKNN